MKNFALTVFSVFVFAQVSSAQSVVICSCYLDYGLSYKIVGSVRVKAQGSAQEVRRQAQRACEKSFGEKALIWSCGEE